MRFTKYLKENLRLLVFYFILMGFILLTICFDRQNRVLTSNVLYIIFVSFFMLIIYISIDYYVQFQHIKKLLFVKDSEDKTPILPSPMDYRDEIYAQIIQMIYEDFMKMARVTETDFKENAEFMTAWVHEIKTPITTSKLLLESEEKGCDSLKEEIEKIDDYVEKVLCYSRSNSFSQDYILSEVSINKLIKESIKKHSIIFIKKHIKLINKVPETLIIDTDKKWLLFIIDQLLSNSLKYTSNGGSIIFKHTEAEKEVLLIVEDTGIGIKSEDINRLFKKSFTGFNGRNENLKASGMGLYLSQKIAKKLGHYITLESEYGKGTKVIIHFLKWDNYYDVTKM
ncbi:sensor histidine kinase [Clostridium estertheticum]|uniref:histidine kinase n=2 Tax=Clostridium estertheticum TaxID=238834 RepID=A0A1J0GFK6_9CLOT|nr:sensor histidine kinase [Clostridium estertheticum]APC40109.1 histidine kinase [Clostridium estertheticum subsp. estertheticum]MBU3072379.1 sensor histidine kinase [Clostridium estertheticum]MBU3162472.1 sensor histidine kinase [Clostridium estertheticum]MBU3170326.1 sensor histidine kinase [Clostridium estertheticum]WAG73763.1 sensor histidine kinase [Clostridium estertheticum]